MTLGEILKERRNRIGLSRAQLSLRSMVSEATIERFEGNHMGVAIGAVTDLFRSIGCRLEAHERIRPRRRGGRVMDYGPSTTLQDVRILLQSWGAWWRSQEHRELRERPVGNSHRLIEMARLGISPEKKSGHVPMADFVVPEHIEEIDRMVQKLPQENRAIINFWYVRAPRMKRGAVRKQHRDAYRELLKSELMMLWEIKR